MTEAAAEVFGLEVGPGEDPVRAVEPWGKTDRQILRDVLARAGLPAPDVDEIARWERAACAAYARLEREPPGADDAAAHAADAKALARLRDAGHTLALLTGNLEPIARRKLALRGLGEFFAPGQGGFGSDADLRPELVPIARRRAGSNERPHPAEDTVVIGDTPADVDAARADRVRCIGIAGTRFSEADLMAAGASAVVTAIAEIGTVLAG